MDRGLSSQGMLYQGLVNSTSCVYEALAHSEAGSAQSTVAGINETLETFASVIPWLSGGTLIVSANAQFLSWSETMLGKGALMASETAIKSSPHSDSRHVEIALRLFRLWAALPAVKQGLASPQTLYTDVSGSLSRPSIWRAYYAFLTVILQDDLLYAAPSEGPGRSQLASELRRIESICENNLLRDVKFPTASSNNLQVEEWVEQVIKNWDVLCGPHWQDQDLGEGGQHAVGRNVLDVSTHDWSLCSAALTKLDITDSVSRSNQNIPFAPHPAAFVPRSCGLGGL